LLKLALNIVSPEELVLKEDSIINKVMRVAPIGMAYLNLEGKWLVVNQALYKMFGYQEEAFMKTSFQALTHPEDLPKNMVFINKLIAGEIDVYRVEKRYLHKDGHYVWGGLNVSSLRDEDNKPMLIVAQIVDITARKTAEIEMKKNQEIFQQILQNAPLGKSLLTPDFDWVLINPALCNILGYSKEELLEKKIEDLIFSEDKEIGKEKMIQLFNKEKVRVRSEKRHIHKDGHIIWVELNASIIWSEAAPLYILIQWSDITSLKEKEARIISFNEELETTVEERTKKLKDANKELENFTYVLTHDLRQPLKNMANLSSIILEDYADDLDEEGNYMLSLIEKNANKVDSLIIDMLNYTRSSKFEIQKEAVDLNSLFQQEFEICKSLYLHYHITFKADKLPLVLGDKTALRQVCQNLVSNALKYSSKQEKIEIQISSFKQDNNTVFSVQDNGIGFDESLSFKIFEVFQRLHNESDFDGTGIGMPITAKIIEKHGGKIWAKSSPGNGATFYFTLPVYTPVKFPLKGVEVQPKVSQFNELN
jgi:PAS domain S-box-containing protein